MKKYLIPVLLFVMFMPFVVNAKVELKVGEYISLIPDSSNYTISKNNTGYSSNQTIKPNELTLWRIIKINNDNSFEAISEYVSSKEVYFSGTIGYANLVDTLQKIANQYQKSGYTSSARMIGYKGQTLVISDTSYFDGTRTTAPSKSGTPLNSGNAEFQGGILGDTLYREDVTLVEGVYSGRTGISTGSQYMIAYKINNHSSASSYWLASRNYGYNSSSLFYFGNNFISESGYVNKYIHGMRRYYNNQWGNVDRSHAIRPIITLKPNLAAYAGNGSIDSPYSLKTLGKGKIIINNDALKGLINGIEEKIDVEELSDITFNVIPSKGYILNSIIIKDLNDNVLEYNSTQNENEYSFIMPDSDVTITPTYEKIKSSVNVEIVNETEDFSVELNDMTQVEYEEEVKFKLTPIKGYNVKSIQIKDEEDNEIDYSETENKNEYVFTMPASNVTIIPSYERVSSSVSVNDNKYTKEIVIEVGDTTAVVYEDKVKFTLEPVDGYEVESIEIKDKEGNSVEYRKTDKENEYEFTMSDTDVVITPLYRKIESINVPDTLINPNTGDKFLTVILLMITSLGLGTFFFKKKESSKMKCTP